MTPSTVSYAEAFSSTPCRALVTNLPSYPWDHAQSFWKESAKSANFRQRTQPPLSLLGVHSAEDAAHEFRWLNTLRLPDVPWLQGHKVEGQVIYPAAGYLVMALEATKALDETSNVRFVELYDVSISSAIKLDYESAGVDIRFTLRRSDGQPESTTADWACYTSSGGGNGWDLLSVAGAQNSMQARAARDPVEMIFEKRKGEGIIKRHLDAS